MNNDSQEDFFCGNVLFGMYTCMNVQFFLVAAERLGREIVWGYCM